MTQEREFFASQGFGIVYPSRVVEMRALDVSTSLITCECGAWIKIGAAADGRMVIESNRNVVVDNAKGEIRFVMDS